MANSYIPKLQLNLEIADTKLNTNQFPMRMNSIGDSKETPNFQQVFTGLVKEMNNTAKAPDQVIQSAITGNGADIHDAMIAISKAELSMNIATQMTTKVVQAYDKITQIQV